MCHKNNILKIHPIGMAKFKKQNSKQIDQWFLTTAPGPQVLRKQPWSAPWKIWNPQYFSLKTEVWLRYEGFSDNFIVRCSATFKRLGNTEIDNTQDASIFIFQTRVFLSSKSFTSKRCLLPTILRTKCRAYTSKNSFLQLEAQRGLNKITQAGVHPIKQNRCG